jgi:osmotically-inducible protein OsmY
VRAAVADSVVTLTGRVDRRSTAQLVVGVARAVAGVVNVVDRIIYLTDDTARQPARR